MMKKLNQAGAHLETDGVDEVVGQLRNLREAWAAARELLRRGNSKDGNENAEQPFQLRDPDSP